MRVPTCAASSLPSGEKATLYTVVEVSISLMIGPAADTGPASRTTRANDRGKRNSDMAETPSRTGKGGNRAMPPAYATAPPTVQRWAGDARGLLQSAASESV